MAITLVQAEEKLSSAMDALESAMKVQSYSTSTDTDGFSASNQSLGELKEQVVFWEKKVNRLSRGGIRIGYMRSNG